MKIIYHLALSSLILMYCSIIMGLGSEATFKFMEESIIRTAPQLRELNSNDNSEIVSTTLLAELENKSPLEALCF